MFKKLTATILSLLFVFAAFGMGTVFQGFITADAVYYDYYEYTQLPGWTEFTEQDLDEIYAPGLEISQVDAPANAPDRVDKATAFTVTNTSPGEWAGHITLTSYTMPNLGEIHSGGEPINMQWAAKAAPSSGKTITGGYDFTYASGISFWVGRNDGPETGTLKINVFAVPSKGVYYTGDDTTLEESTPGFCFSADVRPDEDGYVYLDFKTSFEQVDWYWKHDDGNNYTILNGDQGIHPFPYNARPLIGGMHITFLSDTIGDVLYIGDFCAYSDTRVHLDALTEALDIFDAIDPEAYTEESYSFATDVYFRAFEMATDENITENYTQKDVDDMKDELMAAIDALLPLFPIKVHDITLNGFESLTDDDLEAINDGGVSIDLAAANPAAGPEGIDALEIVANADPDYNPPYYGWSSFSTLADNGNGPEAVGNVFGADLNGSAGLRFWLKNPEDQVPLSMQIFVGKAGEAEFIAEDYSISRPMEAGGEGYVNVSWNAFYDYLDNGADIYEYLDQLDYITIQFEDLRSTLYSVADLHVYNWSMLNADLTEINTTIAQAYAYMSTLNKNDYTPRSWSNLEAALTEAEELIINYGVNQDEVDAANEKISKSINNLTPIGTGPTLEQLNYLETLLHAAKTYWRGNYVPTSYNALGIAIADAEDALEFDMTVEKWQEKVNNLSTATAALTPITHGGIIEDGIFSFESYSSRDFSKTTGDRSENVNYYLVKRADAPFLPEGYDQALKMESVATLYSENTDEHGSMQFKSMYREAGSPKFIKPSNGNPLVDDLTGSDGVRVWVSVNDVNLISEGRFRVGMSNCHSNPLFEMHAIDIPLPPTGSGWIYIPWNYFDYYDEWTNGEPMRLNEIGFYIFRFAGKIEQGLEVYITGLEAYTNTTASTNEQPVINITEGQTIDVSEGAFTPDWNVGAAILDNAYFPYGNSINTNGDHTIVITNGDKTTSVNFTIVGGSDEYSVPVVNGIMEGGKYESTTITWDVGTATLNGEVFAKNTTVKTPGEYTLVVTNGDKVVTINFTIVEPTSDVTKGDPDGDGVITVSDALYTLRIAAQLTEATESDFDVIDIDGDGSITVSDALAILRVAAQLADSL